MGHNCVMPRMASMNAVNTIVNVEIVTLVFLFLPPTLRRTRPLTHQYTNAPPLFVRARDEAHVLPTATDEFEVAVLLYSPLARFQVPETNLSPPRVNIGVKARG